MDWLINWDKFQLDVANTILTLVSQVLRLAGILFNYVMDYTINFSALVTKVGVVDIGWTTFRNLSNMVFIFILLAISIATILGIQNYGAKNLLKNVILVALLINFSLFATKIIIDAANVFTVGFYNATIEKADQTGINDWDKGISSMFASSLNLHTIYKQGDFANSSKDETGVTLGPNNIWTVCIMGSVFLIVTAFVFFAASILLIKRIVILMFLMMLSPLAFLGMILPATSGYSKQWWNKLFKEAFYAPVFMMFIYVVALGINSDAFRNSIGKASATTSFANTFTGGAGDGMSFVIFNFILIIGLMLASIFTASKLGATGASGMMSMGKNLNKWGQGKIKAGAGAATFGVGGRLARRVVGGAAQRRADRLSDTDYAETARGKLEIKTLRKVGDSSFDFRNTDIGKKTGMGTGIKGGYKTRRDKVKQADIAYAKSLKGETQATDDSGSLMTDPTTGAKVMISRTESYAKNNESIWSKFVTGATEGLEQAGEAIKDVSKNKAELKNLQREVRRAKEVYEDARKKIGNAQYSNQTLVQQEVDRARDALSGFEDNVDTMKDKIKKAAEKAKADTKPKAKADTKPKTS